MCLYICHTCAWPSKSRRGHQIPGARITGSVNLLMVDAGTELGISAEAACAFNGRAVSPASITSFLWIIYRNSRAEAMTQWLSVQAFAINKNNRVR